MIRRPLNPGGGKGVGPVKYGAIPAKIFGGTGGFFDVLGGIYLACGVVQYNEINTI